MSNSSYALPLPPVTFGHHTFGPGWGRASVPAWLGDHAEPANDTGPAGWPGKSEEYEIREFNAIDAMAASGDYFITLATRLDKLAQGLPQDSAEQIELEHIVRTLFYLQEHWELVGSYKQDCK